jgi:hypothetical protein
VSRAERLEGTSWANRHEFPLIVSPRYLHSLAEGDDIEIRGPIKTVSVPVQSLDSLTMVCNARELWWDACPNGYST